MLTNQTFASDYRLTAAYAAAIAGKPAQGGLMVISWPFGSSATNMLMG